MKIGTLIGQRKRPFFSLEFFPPKEKAQWPAFFDTLEQLRELDPLFISVTYGAGGSTQHYTRQITAELAARGLTPMAHLTCVGATEDSIRSYLDSLLAAGVNNILALRGDPPKDRDIVWEECPFTYASDLVRFVRRECADIGIGVAAYPTPHPESASFAFDRETTAFKLNQGSDFAVTQLFFDPREYFEYVEQMAALGITKPIVPGVLPVSSLGMLKRVLALSGSNMPAKLFLELEEADKTGGAEAVARAGIAHAIKQIRTLIDGGAPGVHLYTLNQAETCLRIAREVGPLVRRPEV